MNESLDEQEVPFKMNDGSTYMLSNRNYVEFGDFSLKLIAEVIGASECYWLCTCETYVRQFLERRRVILPTSCFDSKSKFITSLREQFSSGSFSLSGSVSQRDIVEFYKFLKNDYNIGASPRMCKFIQHLGHQRDEYWFISEKVQLWKGNLVAEENHKFLCMSEELKLMATDMGMDILRSKDTFKTLMKRYITLASRAFLDNQYAFIAATAFVLWRIMANALEGVEKGEANIGLIYSTSRSVGKTTALEVLAYGQGCQRKDHPLLVSLGDQCISGTSLKMVMEKLSMTTFVVFLDDGKMTSTLAEFLLQLQGGLSQGSTSQGRFVPKGSVILTSNYHEPERLVGRVIKFPFTSIGTYSREVESAMQEILALARQNKGLLTLWAVRYMNVYKAAVDLGLDSEISEVLSSFLPPNQQARWVKGVAGVILTQTLLLLTTGQHTEGQLLQEVLKQHRNFLERSTIQSTLQKLQLSLLFQIKADPSQSKVLSWLNPSARVNSGGKSFVAGVAIKTAMLDQWPEVSRQEIGEEAAKHGQSTVNVAVAFGTGDPCSPADLAKRSPNSTMKKAIKLPKDVLNKRLVDLIETVTGTGANTEGIQADVYDIIREEVEPESSTLAEMPAEPRKKVEEVLSKLQNLIQESSNETSQAVDSPDYELTETLQAMSPRTKRTADELTPRKLKVFVQGYARGLARRDSQLENQSSSSSNLTSSSYVSGAIGVFQKQDTSKSKDADNDDTCHMCQMEEPTGVRTKEVLWIQCGKCQHWYHQKCAGIKKLPKENENWFCNSCK